MPKVDSLESLQIIHCVSLSIDFSRVYPTIVKSYKMVYNVTG